MTILIEGGSPDVACTAGGAQPTTYDAAGIGTLASPYILCNAAQLAQLSVTPSAWSAAFRLGSNIDLAGNGPGSSAPFTMIGTEKAPFAGTFDGNGHVVSNLKLSMPSATDVGFFGLILGGAAEVRDFNLVGANVAGGESVGILAGRCERGARVLGSSTQGTVTGNNYVGGLIGTGYYGAVVSSSWSSATVTGKDTSAGLVGLDQQGLFIFNSYATGTVSANTNAGGLVGSTDSGGVYRSYSTATVTSTSAAGEGIGGLVGSAHGTIFEDCFAAGTVSAMVSGSVGRFGGDTPYGTFTNDFDLATSTCQAGASACAADSKSVPLAQLQDPTKLPLSGWDLAHTWKQSSGGFPSLSSALFSEETWNGCSAHAGDLPVAGGDGTPDRPYLICSAPQFAQLGTTAALRTAVYVRQMASIDFSMASVTLQPIGTAASPFIGVYDGHGKALSNFTLKADNQAVGLFGTVTGTIIRASATNGTVTGGAGASSTGLLVGALYGTVNDSFVTGAVTGPRAGAFGSVHTQIGCYSNATVTATSGDGAGLNVAGGSDGLVYDSFASSTVDAVSGTAYALTPTVNSASQISNSFYDSTKCSACKAVDATSKTTSYFFSTANAPLSSWDFTTVWQASTNGFPTLR